jgi:hypothetical protein
MKTKLLETPVIQVNAALRYLSQLDRIRFKPLLEVDVHRLRQIQLHPKVK